MYFVQQFRDGDLQKSEALAEFSIVFPKRIPLQQNDVLVKDVSWTKSKKLHICRC